MRRALTLIELIFSMVIIALAFTIFPKIVQVSAQSAKYTLQEEELYNALALIGQIKNLHWDEQNTRYNDILLTNGEQAYECGYSFGGKPIYRIGSFVGSRNCLHKLSASAIGSENGELEPDDIDDFNGFVKDIHDDRNHRIYRLQAKVYYIKDPKITDKTLTLDPAMLTNTKAIEVNVTALKKKGAIGSGLKFWYVSTNIGELRVYSEPWSGR